MGAGAPSQCCAADRNQTITSGKNRHGSPTGRAVWSALYRTGGARKARTAAWAWLAPPVPCGRIIAPGAVAQPEDADARDPAPRTEWPARGGRPAARARRQLQSRAQVQGRVYRRLVLEAGLRRNPGGLAREIPPHR